MQPLQFFEIQFEFISNLRKDLLLNNLHRMIFEFLPVYQLLINPNKMDLYKKAISTYG